MTNNWQREVARARLVAHSGAEQARLIAPTDPPRAYAPVPGLDLAAISPEILGGYAAATRPLKFPPSTTESNDWVIGGALSASGKPLLANDPHRAIALPSLRYLTHLHAPGWNVIGSGEPALPGVAVGHNERSAWGFTIVGTDQSDLYVEQTKPDGPRQYRVGDRWEPMRIIRDSLNVRGKRYYLLFSPWYEVWLRFDKYKEVLLADTNPCVSPGRRTRTTRTSSPRATPTATSRFYLLRAIVGARSNR